MNWKSPCRSFAMALSATAMLTSCSDQGIVGGEWNGATRIEVTPADLQLNAGEAKPLTLGALDSSGEPVEFTSTDGFDIVWRSSDTTVAKVEGNGTTVQVRGMGAGTAQVTVTVTPEGSQMRLSASAEVVTLAAAASAQAAAGDDQTGVVGQVLPQNLAVRIVDQDGKGVAGVTVNFATENGGQLDPSSASTDDSGVAHTGWQLGPRAGAQRVTASTTGGASVVFDAMATAASPDTIRIQAGTGQTGLISQPLEDTLVVRLADRFGNPVPNTAVTWAVVSGGGAVAPVSPNSNSTGLARAIWTLGSEVGTQKLRASSGELFTEFAANASTTPPPNNPDSVAVAPSTVTDLRVVSATENSVTLSWTAVSDGDDGSAAYALRTGSPTLSWGSAYETERAVAPGTIGQPVTYTYTGLTSGTTYQFQLVSYRGTLNQSAVFGARSNVVTRATSTPAVASVTLTPSSANLTEIGQVQQLVATARDASGRTLSGISFDWSSSNSSIVSVDNMGRITARGAGTALVIACAAGCDAADTTNVEVDPGVTTPEVASVIATPPTHTFTAVGQTQQISVAARDESGNALSGVLFNYTSTASDIVSVDSNGRMTARRAGTAAIIVTAACCAVADTVNAVVQASEPPPSSSGNAMFSDNFDNGQFNSDNGFSWNGTNERVAISSTHAYSGTHSMRFRFGPDGAGEDSWAEERFTITPSASSAPTEVWIEYMWRVPENYVHRSGGAVNNKFMTLWAENYSAADEAQFYLSLERSSDTNSRLDILAVHGDDPRYPGDSRFMASNFVTPSDYGKWMQVRIHARLDVDGSIRVWKNGTLFTQLQNYNMVRAGANRDYFRHGYLMGWSNSGYSQQTDFYIDDFKIYTSNPGW